MANISKTINPKLRTTITVLLLLSSFISLASQTMMVTALPVIQKEMHVSLTLAQWLTTGYTLIIGVVTPLSSNMYEKFRNRSVFLGTIGTFAVGTLIGCFAHNFWFLLLARLVQACAGGILMSFQMTTMISIYPMEKRSLACQALLSPSDRQSDRRFQESSSTRSDGVTYSFLFCR